MPEERASPSAGWRETYDAMEVSTGAEEYTERDCPDCGTASPRMTARVFRCPTHGPWLLGDAAP